MYNHRAEFLPAVDAVGQRLGIPLTDAVAARTQWGNVQASAMSEDGTSEAHIEEAHITPADVEDGGLVLDTMISSPSAQSFSLRGLLSYTQGTLAIQHTNASRWPYERQTRPFINTWVHVAQHSTPNHINNILSQLGRLPGVDALRLQRISSGNVFTSGQWLEGFAEMTVRVADRTNWEAADHDLNPSDHIQSWIATPPRYCGRIAARAQQLFMEYGSSYGEPANDAPSEVSDFVDAADNLSETTRDIFLAVRASEKPHALRPYVLHGVAAEVNNTLHKTKRLRHESILRRLGISTDEQPTDLRRFKAITASHLAALFIRLEELAPVADDTPQARDERVKTWRDIIEKF